MGGCHHRCSTRLPREMFHRSHRKSRSAGNGEPAGRDSTAVRFDDVTHEYGSSGRRFRTNGDRSVTALCDVSFAVRTGEVVGLTGPSGSGKSTALHAVAGLLVPTAGTVELLGTDLTTLSNRARLRTRRRHVGIVFQRFHLLPSLSARANVALPLVQAGYSKRRRRERATTLLERVGLGDRVSHLPGELSGGEQQRVAIARALATDPDVIVADEPTGELDTATGAAVLELLSDLADDRTVLIATHDVSVLSVVDRTISLRDGTVIEDAR